jgi:hypothetical protein
LTWTAAVDGAAEAVTARDGREFSAGAFRVRGGKIVALDIRANAARLRQLDLAILGL